MLLYYGLYPISKKTRIFLVCSVPSIRHLSQSIVQEPNPEANAVNDAKVDRLRPKFGHRIMKTSTLRIHMSSPGIIFDPFIPRRTRLLMSSLLTSEGWQERWKQLRTRIRATLAVIMIKRRIRGWTSHEFVNEAERIYIQMNEALANEDKNRLHELTTETFYRELRREWSRLHHEKGVYNLWRYFGRIDKPQIANLVIARTPDKKAEFAQITVNLHSFQSLCVYSKEHRILSGNLEKSIPVNDVLVYERSLMDPNGRWRICARLIPPS
jgi:large subunit ribosomal protein L45